MQPSSLLISQSTLCLLTLRNNMADLRDPYGNPVGVTDEYGNPMHVTGVAEAPGSTKLPPQVSYASATMPPHISSVGHGGGVGDDNLMSGPGTGVISGSDVSRLEEMGELGPSTSSSSSSEDGGLGGRRKRRLRHRMKEKLGGGKHERVPGMVHVEPERTSMMEKIKDKLPGHHHSAH